MVLAVPDELPAYHVPLLLMLALVIRAAVVPSTGKRTLIVGILATVQEAVQRLAVIAAHASWDEAEAERWWSLHLPPSST